MVFALMSYNRTDESHDETKRYWEELGENWSEVIPSVGGCPILNSFKFSVIFVFVVFSVRYAKRVKNPHSKYVFFFTVGMCSEKSLLELTEAVKGFQFEINF